MNQKILFSIIIFIALFFGVFLVWLPKYKEYTGLRFQLEEAKAQLATKQEYFEHLQKISDKLKAHEADLQKIDSAIPPKPDIADVLRFLQGKAQANGLLVEGVGLNNSLPVKEFPGLKKTPLSITLAGKYSSYKNFISILEKNSRLININSISFGTAGEGLISFKTQLSFYSY